MATILVKCIHCNSEEIEKNGKTKDFRQYYRCKDCRKKFMLEYKNKGWDPKIDRKIIAMAINGSGIRDTSRVLKISIGKVLETLKKNKKN